MVEGGEEPTACGRCCGDLAGSAELCWGCLGPLCWRCWESAGECGHPELAGIARREARWVEWVLRLALAPGTVASLWVHPPFL